MEKTSDPGGISMFHFLTFACFIVTVIGIFTNSLWVALVGMITCSIFLILGAAYYQKNIKKGWIGVHVLFSFIILLLNSIMHKSSITVPLFWLNISNFVLCFILLYAIHYQSLQLIETPATVISKYTKVSGSFVTTTYYATFLLPDNTRKVLTLDHKTYGLLLEGDSGTLSYKEDAALSVFVNFSVHSPNPPSNQNAGQ